MREVANCLILGGVWEICAAPAPLHAGNAFAMFELLCFFELATKYSAEANEMSETLVLAPSWL